MAVGASQISAWLRERRERARLSRRVVSVRLDVAERTIVRWEDPDDPALPPADQFLTLVRLYGAAADLLTLVARFERATRASGGAKGRGSG